MKTLKLRTLSLAVILLLSSTGFAQNFHYGLKAGTNFAVQSEIADYFSNNNIRTGLTVGAFGNMDINSWLNLQLETNYDQKGGKTDDITLKYDYITVPILAKFSLGKSDRSALKFNVNAGPYAGFLLNAETDTEGATVDLTDNTENFELGVIAGFGMKYPFKQKQNILLDLRLGLGLTSYDIYDTEPNNKYIGLTLGYEF